MDEEAFLNTQNVPETITTTLKEEHEEYRINFKQDNEEEIVIAEEIAQQSTIQGPPSSKTLKTTTIPTLINASYILVYMFYSAMSTGSLAGKVNPALRHAVNLELHKIQGQLLEEIIIGFTQNEVYTNLTLPGITTTIEYHSTTREYESEKAQTPTPTS